MMNNSLEAMSNLIYVKEIIEALPPESKKELFKHFVTLNDSTNGVNRPTTPVTTSELWSFISKRPLNSPGSPQRSKKNGKVLPHLMQEINDYRSFIKSLFVKLLC